jgi:ferredoxin
MILSSSVGTADTAALGVVTAITHGMDRRRSSGIVRKRRRPVFSLSKMTSAVVLLTLPGRAASFVRPAAASLAGHHPALSEQVPTKIFMSSGWNDESDNANLWRSSDDPTDDDIGNQQEDWQDVLARKKDGSFWSTFEPSSDDDDDNALGAKASLLVDDGDDLEDDSELWLNTLASISADEVEFNMLEAERADKVRQMQEWGFDTLTIQNTFGVAVNDELETKDELVGMKEYRKMTYIDVDEDLKKVESHTQVEKDAETGEPFRQQMVYVDEHTCIGCTNCAMIAQSTFFMHEEHGRARVFRQWGDDDETIQVAIETCPVDCIHYVPYDELVKLEKERRDQNINPKARLVSQAEYTGGLSHMVGGANGYTAPQKISGNMGSRCNNCPSRGCRTCPMFGVGKNPEFERKERERKARLERNRLKKMREEESKSADL